MENRMRRTERTNWSQRILFVALLFVSAFIFNLIWEYLHYPLYICTWERVSCSLVAGFYDALITLGIYAGGLLLFRAMFWFTPSRVFRNKVLSYTYLFLSSFIIAYGIELRALLTDRWTYAASMPIIPLLNVGLSPIAQLLILVPLSLFVAKYVTRYVTEKLVSGVTPLP